ncbi:transposase [Bacteroidia bacterium]|nr:transposase [Bacteroidia bacterium]
MMTPTDNATKLVKIYCYVCEQYEKELKYLCQRFSNNNNPEFTDQEAMTIYLYSMHVEHHFKVKHIHEFASEHLRSWFPTLPSYVAFVNRINRLNEAFKAMVEPILTNYQPLDCDTGITLIDSMPVITCSGKRKAKVAKEITDKGFCSTKGIYYYGLKLHALGFRRKGHLPHPERLLFTEASVNDLTFLKENCDDIFNRTFFGDKIYGDKDFWHDKQISNQLEMLTPIKGLKGQTEQEKQRNKAFVDVFSSAVSSVREPIESLFNWLIEKTDIQRAGKVRSTKGLLSFVCGRIAAAFMYLIF